jgi:hypothetical protein
MIIGLNYKKNNSKLYTYSKKIIMDLNALTDLLNAVASLFIVLIVVLFSSIAYGNRKGITKYIQNQNLRISKLNVSNVFSFEFQTVKTPYGQMNYPIFKETYHKPENVLTSTNNCYCPKFNFKISWPSETWDKDDEAAKELETNLKNVDTSFDKIKIPILVKRNKSLSKIKINENENENENEKVSADTKEIPFHEYITILIENLPIEYSTCLLKPRKKIQDFLAEMPQRKNIRFDKTIIDKNESQNSAFLVQTIHGTFYNPIDNKKYILKDSLTQFQKIIIDSGMAYRVIAIGLPENKEDSEIKDQITYIINSFKLIKVKIDNNN